MLSWIEVRIRVPAGAEDLAAESFCVPPFTGMTIEPGCVVTYFSSAFDGAAEREALRARILESGALDVEFRAIEDEDYGNAWKETWRAFRVGNLCIVPTDANPRLRASDVPLRLDPGGAFGTGKHGSTRGSLMLLQHYLRAGDEVIDAGSGSGILTVACALLGARKAFGFDIDPNAKPHGDELASRNGVADRCTFLAGGFEDLPAAAVGYDGLLANIYLDILLGYGRALRERVRSGGWFVMSGVRFTERARLVDHLSNVGFALERETRRGKWLTVAGRAI